MTTLFPECEPAPVTPAEPPAKISTQRRRSMHGEYCIQRGVHPHTGLPLLGRAGATCGNCAHHKAVRYAGTYHKCDQGRVTGGPGTDIRTRWPACTKWEEAR